MVFKPGPDPNRNMCGSRSKKDQEFFAKLRKFEPQTLKVIKARLDNNDFEAAKWVNEMLYGKPKQRVEAEHTGEVTVNVVTNQKGIFSGNKH